MAEIDRRVRVEELDWVAMLPWLRLFRSFRMAVDPYKLGLALSLVVLIYMGGRLLDVIWPAQATPGEITTYAISTPQQFDQWREEQVETGRTRLAIAARSFGAQVDSKTVTARQAAEAVYDHFREEDKRYADEAAKLVEITGSSTGEGENKVDVTPQLQRIQERRDALRARRDRALNEIRELTPRGIFDQALRHELEAFTTLVDSAVALDFGVGDLLRGGEAQANSVVGALRQMFITVPGWLYHAHPWFLLFFAAGALVVWSVIGGAIARMAALEATRGEKHEGTEPLRFAYSRIGWFLFTPVFPFLVIGLLGLALVIGGFVFFNWPVLDIVGGAGFALALLAGFIIAGLLLLMAAGGHMFYPALAVEGTDTFDVISRAFGYVINRPWQWLFYTAVALVYGAITYLFIGALIFMTLMVTQHFISSGVIRMAEDVGRFDAMLPPPQFGVLAHEVNWSVLSLPGKAAAALVWVWVFLLVGSLAAYAVSYYLCAHTWIYLLLRQATDGTEMDDVYVAGSDPAVRSGEEPASAAVAAAEPVPPAATTMPTIPDKVEPSSPSAGDAPGA
jgi:hypothetical protein